MTICNKILEKINENYNFSFKKGIIIASPSINPPYKFHWIRDAALVMRVFIEEYKKSKNNNDFNTIINYIEREKSIQNLDTISGLGEPKINIDSTPFNGNWGRPQNDGPALRCLNFLKLYKLFKNDYKNITKNLIVKIIEKDVKYILSNYDNPSFDLWEEIKGWHFYTRLVQLKCLKEYNALKKELDLFFNIEQDVDTIYNKLLSKVKHHINQDESFISSIKIDGTIERCHDASIILAFCHIDYDKDIIREIPIEYALKNVDSLLTSFRSKYNDDNINLIGRYANDEYFNGHLWVICCLALAQFYLKLAEKDNKFAYLKSKANSIYSRILSIDENLNLPEQFDLNNNKISALKLTWNYSELYHLLKLL